MGRWTNIFLFMLVAATGFAQETRIVDSLETILPTQQGRDKVLTMIELTWEFYPISFDDCIDWGEKAIKEAHDQGFADLEADATYALAMQYGYHADLDLAKAYLKKAYRLHQAVNNESRGFEDLWNQAYFEQVWGNVDTAYQDYKVVLAAAERLNDSLAIAQVHFNLAIIQYHWQNFGEAEIGFKKSSRMYRLLGDTLRVARTNANLANLYSEWSRYDEAERLFHQVIPTFEAYSDYGWLLRVYKNFGQLFAKGHVDLDSASYYFMKALACTEHEALSQNSSNAMANEKSDLLVEMGNVALLRQDEKTAEKYFMEAHDLAEGNKYHFGRMQAALSIGQLYANQGKAAASLHYLTVYADEAALSGITMMEPTVKKPLIIDYARLDRFEEMEAELDALDEHRAALMRENADVYTRLNALQDEAATLVQQYESQNQELSSLKSALNQYRLAFFGLLAIVLAVLVFAVAHKIVRKNKAKRENIK